MWRRPALVVVIWVDLSLGQGLNGLVLRCLEHASRQFVERLLVVSTGLATSRRLGTGCKAIIRATAFLWLAWGLADACALLFCHSFAQVQVGALAEKALAAVTRAQVAGELARLVQGVGVVHDNS
jgi:hypothetical protein